MTAGPPGRRGSLVPLILALAALSAGAACRRGEPPREAANGEPQPQTVDIPQTVTSEAPGTTPMAQRVAVLKLLNKRNGLEREFALKPGQAVRLGDAIVRLRACETSAPWEVQKLTGAFVQLDVRSPKGQFQRVFSGWLYSESPSLNTVEHPIYDVWPKSCAMTRPGGEPPASASSRSSAPNSKGDSSAGGGTAAPKASPTKAAAKPAGKAVSNTLR
jgi:hypothetical protein